MRSDEDGGSAAGLAASLLGVLAVTAALVLATGPAVAARPAGADGCRTGTESTVFGLVCGELPAP